MWCSRIYLQHCWVCVLYASCLRQVCHPVSHLVSVCGHGITQRETKGVGGCRVFIVTCVAQGVVLQQDSVCSGLRTVACCHLTCHCMLTGGGTAPRPTLLPATCMHYTRGTATRAAGSSYNNSNSLSGAAQHTCQHWQGSCVCL